MTCTVRFSTYVLVLRWLIQILQLLVNPLDYGLDGVQGALVVSHNVLALVCHSHLHN